MRKDLLDAYQFRLGTNLDEAEEAAERGFDSRCAETAAIAAGYWRIIAPEYREQLGGAGDRDAWDATFKPSPRPRPLRRGALHALRRQAVGSTSTDSSPRRSPPRSRCGARTS